MKSQIYDCIFVRFDFCFVGSLCSSHSSVVATPILVRNIVLFLIIILPTVSATGQVFIKTFSSPAIDITYSGV